jgi:PAS domain-containing protein
MKNINKNKKLKKGLKDERLPAIGSDFFERSWRESWIYIKTLVDVMREPILILDKDFHVLAANGPFYRLFKVKPKDTEGKIVYELGNGQWNIPSLRKLLKNVLPKNSLFKGFEVAHEFPKIGRKVMILNARQLHYEKNPASKSSPPIILLALEDVTDMMAVAEMLAHQTNQFVMKTVQHSEQAEARNSDLKKEISLLKDNLLK